MRTEEILIIKRSDLIREAKEKAFDLVERKDMAFATIKYDKASLVLFVEDDGLARILKSKYTLAVINPEKLD